MRSHLRIEPRRLLSPDFLIPAAIFIFAFAIRAYGVRGSLPYVAHPDEPKLIDSATHMVKSGDLNPHLFIWPSLYFYFEALVVRANLAVGTLRGAYTGPQSLPDVSHIYALAPGIYVWARTFTAFVGAATVTLLFFVGKEMFNNSRRVGTAAALMLAVSPLHIEYSHYALTDVPLGLAGLLVLWASYRLSRTRPAGVSPQPTQRNTVFWACALCGLLVGVATGTKYNGLYTGIVPLIAWWMLFRRAGRGNRGAMLAGLAAIAAAALAGFLLSEPYALLDWTAFYRGFTFQVGAYVPAQNLGEVWSSVQKHVSDLSASDMYFFFPAVMGAVVLLFNPPVRNRAWLLVPFPLLYLLAMSRFSLVYVRNLIVTLPFLAIISGYLLDVVAMQIANVLRGYLPALAVLRKNYEPDAFQNRGLWNAVRWAALAAAVALIIAEPLRVSFAYSGYMGKDESRNLAWSWMQGRMREGDRFAAELHPWQTQDWPDVLAFDVENPDTLMPLTARPPSWYAEHGYGYLVLSSNFKDAKRDTLTWNLYKALPVIKLFAGDKEGGKGPTVTVLASGGAQSALPKGTTPASSRIEDFAQLTGYNMAPLTSTSVLLDPAANMNGSSEYKVGQAVGLNLYIRALRDGQPADARWQVWVHLVSAATGKTVAQIDVAPLAGMLQAFPNVVQQPHPISNWHKGELVAGTYNFNLPQGIEPGTYRVETGMWVPPDGPGATVKSIEPNSPADRVELGEISVK